MHLTGVFEHDEFTALMEQGLVWHKANRGLLHYIFIVLKVFFLIHGAYLYRKAVSPSKA